MELNLTSDFEAGMKCFQNPSTFSSISPLSLIYNKLYSNWKWGALILAIFATFTRLINRMKMFIHAKSVASRQQSCSDDNDFDFEVSDDDDDDDTSSSVSSVFHEEALDSEDYRRPAIEIFRENGCDWYCRNDRRRKGFPSSDLLAGRSVVRLWDSFYSEGYGFEYESEGAISDLDWDMKVSSGQWWRSPVAAGNVVATVEINNIDGGGGLCAYDDNKTPAIYEEWQPRQWEAYFKDNGADIVNETESDWEKWSEVDGVNGQRE